MFNIHQSIFDDHGEHDERLAQCYIDGLTDEFADSPEAATIREAGDDPGWVGMLMHYGINYLGVTPAEMTLLDHDEVLFELVPRKVSTEAESAPEIIEELRAFWKFLDRQYKLPEAKRIVAELNDDAVESLKRELSIPENFGMAKSLFMFGKDAGFDMTTQEGLDQCAAAYNMLIAGQRLSDPPVAELRPRETPPQSGKSPSQLRAERKKKRKARQKARRRNRK